MAKVITFYNHKGGVSKTTTTFNVGNLLADLGKKILFIDADPQCNLTEICLSPLIDRLDGEMLNTGNENDLPGTSILQVLKPRINGEEAQVNIESIESIEINENLYLIRGDVDLSSIEDSLSEAHQQRFSSKIHEKRTYVAIGDFISRYADKLGFEYVLIDVGPSSGALTRAMFLACDAFFVPVSLDRFNIQALKTLSKIIDRWISEHNQIIPDFTTLDLPIKHGKPQFLGTIPQFYKVYRGVAKPGYRLWMQRLPTAVNLYLYPVLTRHSIPGKDLTSGLQIHEVSTPEIQDFQSLGTLMQEFGVPIYRVEQSMTASITDSGQPWGGGTWNGAVERMNNLRTNYQAIIDRLAKII